MSIILKVAEGVIMCCTDYQVVIMKSNAHKTKTKAREPQKHLEELLEADRASLVLFGQPKITASIKNNILASSRKYGFDKNKKK